MEENLILPRMSGMAGLEMDVGKIKEKEQMANELNTKMVDSICLFFFLSSFVF